MTLVMGLSSEAPRATLALDSSPQLPLGGGHRTPAGKLGFHCDKNATRHETAFHSGEETQTANISTWKTGSLSRHFFA